MTHGTGKVDILRSVDPADPPGRMVTPADLTLPRLPSTRWDDPGRSKLGHRAPYRRRSNETKADGSDGQRPN